MWKTNWLWKQIISHPEFSVMRIFSSIEPWSTEWLDGESLSLWLRQNGYLITQDEIISIIRRIDLNQDAVISVYELGQAFKI